MKAKSCFVSVFILLSFFSYSQPYTNLKFFPAQPKPGDKIIIEYDPAGTALEKETSFDAVAYILDGQSRAQDVIFKYQNNKWHGDIVTNESAKALYIVFKKDPAIDNNNDKGYSLLLYSNNEPVKGSYIALADFRNSLGSFLMQVPSDPQQAVTFYEKDFNRYPDLKTTHLLSYTKILTAAENKLSNDKLKPIINELAAKKNKSENDYQMLVSVYQTLGDEASSDKWKAEELKKFPKGSLVRSEKLSAFKAEPDLKKKQALLNSYVKSFPATNDIDKKSLNAFYSAMASAASAKKDWALFKKYSSRNTDKDQVANSYKSVAWSLMGRSMEAKVSKEDLLLAKEFSNQSIAYLKASLKNHENKPYHFSDKEYNRRLMNSIGSFTDTYAIALWKLGEKEEALKAQETAIHEYGFSGIAAIEKYITYKESVKGLASVKKDIAGFFIEGKTSPVLKETLHKSFIAGGNAATGYEQYYNDLVKEYKVNLKKEILHKLISKEAPAFALKDLSGNMVSLNDLKGKVAIIDFWATWCGPCRASFPAMQTVINNYKDDADVRFLFIDCFEKKPHDIMLRNASEFINKNHYSFQVLLDSDDIAINDYTVSVIPAKFVIDPAGKIRFKTTDFDGSSEKLIDELTATIEILKSEVANGTQKAF